jgi:hypothetical protein
VLSVTGDGDDNYGTMLQVEDDVDVIHSGGIGGPKLWGDNRLNVHTGRNPDHGLRAVLVRCDPRIERLLLVLEDGTSVDITARSGEVIDGLRFGVGIVHPDSRLRELVGVGGDGTVVERFEFRCHD